MISRRNKIPPIGLFFMLYISRVVVSLTNVQSVTFTELSTDILISCVLSLGLTLLLALPAIFCYRKHKNPFDIKFLGVLYFIYFVFATAVNISRFSYFASTTLNPETQSWIFAFFIALCAFYCSALGIEALSRFSFFAFVLMLLAVITILLSNLKTYDEINLYPVVRNSKELIFRNALIMSSNSMEIAIFLCLRDKINGVSVKSFVSSITAAYFTVFMLLLFMLAVLGDSASMQSFPLYSMFQISKISSFERLDILHISFWIMAIFVKSVLLIYCASVSVKRFKNKNKCFAAAVLTFVVSMILINTGISGNIKPIIIIIPFIIFCAVIPLLVLIFKKKNKGDELVKRF